MSVVLLLEFHGITLKQYPLPSAWNQPMIIKLNSKNSPSDESFGAYGKNRQAMWMWTV